MSILKKLAGDTAIYGLSSILGRLINYLLVPFYTRLFPETEYGIISDLYAWTAMVMVIYLFRMETSFFRFYNKKEVGIKAYPTAMISVVTEALLFSGLMILFSDQVASWLQYPGKGIYITVFASILALDAISEIPYAKLRADSRPMRFAIVRLTNIFVNVLSNLFFLLLLPWILQTHSSGALHDFAQAIYRPDFGIGYVFVSNLLASLTTLIMLLPEILKTKWKIDVQLWKQMLLYSAPLVIAGLAGIINEVIDRTLLKTHLVGSLSENLKQVGIYSANYKIATLLALFTQAYRYAAEPFFFAQAEDKNAPHVYAKSTFFFFLASSVGVIFIGSWLDIIILILGKGYREGLGIIPIILFANLFLGIFYNMAIWYKIKDKTYVGAIVGIIGALITLALNWILIPKIGYFASAWATLACYVTMVIIVWAWGQKVYPIPYPIRKMVGVLALVLIVLGINYYLTLQTEHYGTWVSYGIRALLTIGFVGLIVRVGQKAFVKS